MRCGGRGILDIFMAENESEYERLIESLNDDDALTEYKAAYDRFRPSLVPRILGGILIASGNLLYGRRPTYRKFRAIEIIARIPYHSWASAAFTLLTLHYADERRAVRLSKISRFAAFASENETMHVVVISCLAKAHADTGILRRTLIPVFFGFFYFWSVYLVYLFCPRWSFEMNYLFENHAFEQYDLFLKMHERELTHAVVESEYLTAYGRHPRTQYDFIRSVRNDELAHRNRSAREALACRTRARTHSRPQTEPGD